MTAPLEVLIGVVVNDPGTDLVLAADVRYDVLIVGTNQVLPQVVPTAHAADDQTYIRPAPKWAGCMVTRGPAGQVVTVTGETIVFNECGG